MNSPDLRAFLAVPAEAMAAEAARRAAARDLVLPPATRAAVVENLILLQGQIALVAAALAEAAAGASPPLAPFEP